MKMCSPGCREGLRKSAQPLIFALELLALFCYDAQKENKL